MKEPEHTKPSQTPEISVLVTCYFEEKSVDEFIARVSDTLNRARRTYEIIAVNDGSTDATWDRLKDLYAQGKIRCIMDFFQNSGQQAAITAGLAKARGKAILLMDSDLQLAPEEIPVLLSEYDKGYDVVSGYRKERKDPFTRIVPSKLANIIMRKASKSQFRDFGCTFKLYNARLLSAFNFGPHHLFSNVEAIAKAGRRMEVPITHFPRKYGKSGWTFRKLWKYNMDNIVSLSDRPFQVIALASIAIAALFILRILLAFVLDFRVLSEVTPGLVLNVLIAISLVLIGILSAIGELVIRIFTSSRKLPMYIVREEFDRLADAPKTPCGEAE